MTIRHVLVALALAALAARPAAIPTAGAPDAASIARLVTSVAELVEREYFDAPAAARVAAALRRHLAEGRYTGASSPASLASRVTEDLRAETHDLHLAVMLAPQPAAVRSLPSSADESRANRGRRENFGVAGVEFLPGNVACVTIDSFYRLDEARPAIEAAMALTANADALILDLRANGGGAPDTVAFLASFLVTPGGEPLFEIVPRSGEPHRYARVPTPDRGTDTTRPVYALTSKRTFSAGEGLPFLLQALGRAEVVGERTAGAANPGRAYPAGDGFEVVVPNGRVRVAGAAGNWEGTGVVPDVPAASDDARRVAHARAVERLARGAPPGSWQDTLLGILHGLRERRH